MSVSFSTVGDPQLVRYLLGLLPEDESERLDEASIADDEMAARLRIAETDLVDAYVTGALEPELRRHFESTYLGTRRRRESVAFAGRFLRAIDRAAGNHSAGLGDACVVRFDPGRQAAAEERPAIAFRRRLARKLPMAAAAIVVVSGALLFQSVRTRPPERDAAARVTPPGARSPQPPPADPLQDGRVALRLLPQTRGAGAAIPALTLTSPEAVFELQLEPNEFRRFQAALTDPATNAVVWRSEWLTPSTADPRSVRVTVPADRFKPQHYAFELLGSGAGLSGTAGSYTFEVIRP